MNSLHNVFHGIREYVNPLLKESNFSETGFLTTNEFVEAGDFLVYKCPTWSWESGEESKYRDYLPKDKQFLITRNVPCERRVADLADTEETEVENEEGDGWISAFKSSMGGKDFNQTILDIEDEVDQETSTSKLTNGIDNLTINANEAISPDLNGVNLEDIPDIEDIPEIDDDNFDDNPVAVETVEAVEVDESVDDSNLVKTRTYDIAITYDKYYQTPRVWLFGYTENNGFLKAEQIFEDIAESHAKKTVTYEPHPHLSVNWASIHPCKHASVMKKLIQLGKETKGIDMRVDQYLILFLKFISCVLPTMEYDFTVEAE